MKKVISIVIAGMHCNNCSERIRKALDEMGIEVVEVSYERAILTCYSDSPEIIIAALEGLGYAGKLIDNKKASSYKGILISIMVLFGLYLIIKNTIGFNYIPQLNENVSYPILLILGAVTSLHCISMCGGIVISQSIAFENPIRSTILYNGGRVIAYTVIGGIVGGIGSAVSFSPVIKGYITIFAGGFMILMGISMLNTFKFLRAYLKLPKLFKMPAIKKNSNTPFVIGLATGFMPCGPLQTMQLYALGTGSAAKGALAMLLFSLGTVPLMVGFGTISGYIRAGLNKKLLKLSAVLVMVLGLIIVNRGLALQGRATFGRLIGSQQPITAAMLPELINGYQVINTSANNKGYEPNYFILEKGRTVKWIIRGDEVNGCNNEIIIPSLNISMKINDGYNAFEFTPQEAGQLGFSCWMGMINGSFLIVEDLNALTEAVDWIPAPITPSCCGDRE